jgi:hypothetical protein
MATGFFERLDAARIWETRLMWHFVGLGMSVIPAYAMDENKSRKPVIYAPLGASYTLPDLLTFSGGRGTFYEVKTKRGCFYSRTLQAYATGFDRYLFEDYREVQRITGIKVKIVFIHEIEAAVRYTALDDGPVLERTSAGDMVLWRWDSLSRAAVTPRELTAWDDAPHFT